MTAAESEPIEIEDEDALTDLADQAAERHGIDVAIQRYWTALGHLKRRQAREDDE